MGMYLRTTERRNRDGSEVVYYQLAHNVRHPQTGNTVARVIHNFGRADQLDREDLVRLCQSIVRVCGLEVREGVAFKVVDDPTIDTTSRTGKLIMGILALIAEFENDIRRERQMDGVAKAKDRGVRFGRRRDLTPDRIKEIKQLREGGSMVPQIMRQTRLSKASVYRALST